MRLAIFASGNGSNAQAIINHFKGNLTVNVALIVTNNPQAGVIQRAEQASIPVIQITRQNFTQGDAYVPALQAHGIDFIVLAGFLWKVPPALIAAYPSKIVNIHPALLPKYGGKGMYGHHVHAAVIANGETTSGITIHYVDEQYDHGATIFQATCEVLPSDTPDTLAARIHELEHQHFPNVIEQVVAKRWG